MSISSMTNVALARRDDDLGSSASPITLRGIAVASGSGPRTETGLTAALKAIATYIPTEVIALYLAATAVVRGATEPTGAVYIYGAGRLRPSDGEVFTLVAFAAAVPVVVWAVYAAKVSAAEGDRARCWPWCEMLAAELVFLAWAFGVPDSVFTRFSWYTVRWGAVVLVAVPVVVGVGAPHLLRRLQPTD